MWMIYRHTECVADSPPKIGTVWPNLQLAGEIWKVSGYSETGQVFCFFFKHDLPVANSQKWTEHSQTLLFCLNLSLQITCHINAVWPKPPGEPNKKSDDLSVYWHLTGGRLRSDTIFDIWGEEEDAGSLATGQALSDPTLGVLHSLLCLRPIL